MKDIGRWTLLLCIALILVWAGFAGHFGTVLASIFTPRKLEMVG